MLELVLSVWIKLIIKNREISQELILPAAASDGSRKFREERVAWTATYLEMFYCSENSIKIIQNNFKEKRSPLAHP